MWMLLGSSLQKGSPCSLSALDADLLSGLFLTSGPSQILFFLPGTVTYTKRGQDEMNHKVPPLSDIPRPNYKWKLCCGVETHDPRPRRVQSALEIPAPTCDCRLIRLTPHLCAQDCPRDSPMHSWGPGG